MTLRQAFLVLLAVIAVGACLGILLFATDLPPGILLGTIAVGIALVVAWRVAS